MVTTTLFTVFICALPPWLDPSHRDAARLKAANDPIGISLRDLANATFGPDETFVLLKTHTSARGTHARMQQLHKGVLVEGGQLIAHLDGAGRQLPFTANIIGRISSSHVPAITPAKAVMEVMSDPRRAYSFAAPPTAELRFVPSFRWVYKSNGQPIATSAYAASEDPFPAQDSINASDVRQELVSTYLAWRVLAVEYDDSRRLYFPREWYVDAQLGLVVEVRDARHELMSTTGQGNGYWHPGVLLNTALDSPCYRLKDIPRNFETRTEGLGDVDAVNCDYDNTWGDNLVFSGDATATVANWQTGMVDVHFGASVFWDLLSNVYGLQGVDDDYYDVNQWVHGDDKEGDNAYYNPLSGNITYGDTKRVVHIGVAGHENGHAWNDFNCGLSGGLNESLADIFGLVTEAYLNSGQFALAASSIGSPSSIGWYGPGTKDSVFTRWPQHWFPDIHGVEVHASGFPATRAFALLAYGASPRMHQKNFDLQIPWGMSGIGMQKAFDVVYYAHAFFFALAGTNIPGFDGLRNAAIEAADYLGLTAAEKDAVRNAYAAINVGDTAASTPSAPQLTMASEPNDTLNQAQAILMTAPPSGAVSGAPRKGTVYSGATSTGVDLYTFQTKVGQFITILYQPIPIDFHANHTATISIEKPDGTVMKSMNVGASSGLLHLPISPVQKTTRFVVRVKHTASPALSYFMHVDSD